MNFETSLISLFSEITNQFWNSLEKSMNEAGLHSGQVFILISLWKEDGQIQIDLAKALNLSPPTINKMVKSLSGNGFVFTRRSKNDARKVRVFLTEKGKSIRLQVEKSWLHLENEFFAPLTDTEKLIVEQIFSKLRDSLIIKAEDQ